MAKNVQMAKATFANAQTGVGRVATQQATTLKQESGSSKMCCKTQAECKAKLKKAIEESQALDISRANEYTVATWLRTHYTKLHIHPNKNPIASTTLRITQCENDCFRLKSLKP